MKTPPLSPRPIADESTEREPGDRRGKDPWIEALEVAYRLKVTPGTRLLLAVSGGCDSAALLFGSVRTSTALGLECEVACLDHGLRPESPEEVRAVSAWCAALDVPFHTRALKLAPGPGLEARARDARYRALEEIRLNQSLAATVTAHTASDQAETLLMRLCRGTALRGARGIHASAYSLLRPLLGLTRAEAEAFIARMGVRPFEDATNRDLTFLRARIRHQLLPRFAAVSGTPADGLARRLARFSENASEDEALLEAMADQAFARVALAGGELDAEGWECLPGPLRRRTLVKWIESAGLAVDGALLNRCEAAVRSRGRATLPGDFRLEASNGRIRCVRLPGRRRN
ncbi:MAG TPA: tRNA lysidine(34) synthetase TilS [Myxococcaceae bacterium]|nr:tRNA lysidine(34) synthetase TilS [Myxococcaceae bacterium]